MALLRRASYVHVSYVSVCYTTYLVRLAVVWVLYVSVIFLQVTQHTETSTHVLPTPTKPCNIHLRVYDSYVTRCVSVESIQLYCTYRMRNNQLSQKKKSNVEQGLQRR